jgi:protein involved in polysaccharide export with SLBB domain
VRLQPPDYRPTTIQFALADVLDKSASLTLQPFDTIRIYGRYEVDAPKVSIYGEVLRPGDYPLSHEMTAASLVKMAGGFRRGALRRSADISSYVVENGQKVLTTHATVEISKALDGDSASDVVLKPGDIVTVRRLTGWKDIGAAITLDGEVLYPGTYGIQEGEKLSSVILRAGGFRDTAYPAGAVMQRQEVRRYEEKTRQELVQKIQLARASFTAAPGSVSTDNSGMLQEAAQQQRQVLANLRSQPATGRMVINISKDVSKWQNTPADIEVRPGDLLTIPKRPDFVLVNGQVYNSTAITHVPGKTAEWYLREAGGTTELANKGAIFIIRANGAVVSKNGSGFWKTSVLDTRLQPGDAIIVPEKIFGSSLVWKNLLTAANLMSSLAITAGVVASF